VAALDSLNIDRFVALAATEGYRNALTDYMDATLETEFALPSKIRNFGLALAYSNKGASSLAHHHAGKAISDGLTRDEAIEGLLAGVLARGFGMFWDNLWIAEAARHAGVPDVAPIEHTDTAGILEYMAKTFGAVPQWGEVLAEASPASFEAYFQLRATVFRDAALPRRYKELLLVILNCTERYEFGMDTHMKGALAAGASREELLDACRTSIASGGIVAWVAAAPIASGALAAAGLGR
jgi:alkylhydroperoxidase/carboxymuconolactone decarboxylase family protein YurZ